MECNFSNLSTIAVFDNSLLWEAFSGHCRVSSSMAGPYPIDAYSITQLWQSKSISRHCLSPGGQICWLITTAVRYKVKAFYWLIPSIPVGNTAHPAVVRSSCGSLLLHFARGQGDQMSLIQPLPPLLPPPITEVHPEMVWFRPFILHGTKRPKSPERLLPDRM